MMIVVERFIQLYSNKQLRRLHYPRVLDKEPSDNGQLVL